MHGWTEWTRGFSAVLVCASLSTAGAACLAAEDEPEPSPDPALIDKVLEHDRQTEERIIGLMRVRLSRPQQLSGALGAMWVHQPVDYDCTTVCDFRGVLFQVEPGLAGGQISLGYALVIGEKKRNKTFLSDVYVGFGIKGAVLRTWGDANLDPPAQTFLGAEGDFTISRVNFSLGAFRRVSGKTRDDWLVTGGLGWGF